MMLKTTRERLLRFLPQAAIIPGLLVLSGLLLGVPSAVAAPIDAQPSADTLEFDPSSATAHYHFALAKLHADAGDFEAALGAFEKSLELDASDAYSFLETAKFYGYLAQASRTRQQTVSYLDKSLELLASARKLSPENADILRLFADTHLRLGEQRPSSYAVAQGALEKLQELEPTDLRTLISLGQIYLFSREPVKAADVLVEASRYSPRNRMVQSMLVDALLGAERREEAEKALADLIPLDPTNAEHSLKLANLLSERGEHSGAVKVLESAGEGDWLTGSKVRQTLAREYHLIGEHPKALALLDELLGDPFAASAPNRGLQRLKVSVLSAMTRYGEAIGLFRPLFDEEKDEERRLQDAILLSRLYERSGDFDTAVELLRRESVSPPAGVSPFRLLLAIAEIQKRAGELKAAESTLRGALPPAPSAVDAESIDTLRELALVLMRDDRANEALEVLDGGLQRLAGATGDDADRLKAALRLNLAGIHGELGQWAKMGAFGEQLAASTNPEIAFIGAQIEADALAEQGDLDGALARLDAIEGRERQVLAKRIEVLHGQGRVDQATALAMEVAASGEARDRLFAARLLQRQELYSQSIVLLEELAKEQADQAVLFSLGAAYERTDAYEKSVKTFLRLLETSPDHTPTLNYLGYMWTERGERLEEALAMILRAVAADPDNGAYVDSLGWAYYQLGQYEQARPHLEWATRLTPGDGTVFEHLGDLYRALGEREKAKEAYRRSLKNHGVAGEEDDPEARARVAGKLEALEANAPAAGASTL